MTREPGDDSENEAPSVRTDGVEYRACKKCGCPLAFVVGPNGKHIPLDVRTAVYSIGRDLTGAPLAQRIQGAHPTHFATCPKADSFSSKSRGRR